ncbi:hypothetical protein Tsubulata_006848 [Turnera subulata]|uniref:F-box domain-containing protein n=1 Tax=Turnera subulata TaxID=218843 RepID=A0A9Q0GAW1_9ROSI|nr:hypothetical protein Tsubulata_006848 [Turnera subulata]
MSSSGAVNKRKRGVCGDYNRLLVDEYTNAEQLVISTNMAAPNRSSYLPPDIVEEILDLLPRKSIDRLRSVSKSLFSLLAIKFNVPKPLYCPCKGVSSPSNYGIKSFVDQSLFTGVGLSDYIGDAKKSRLHGANGTKRSRPNPVVIPKSETLSKLRVQRRTKTKKILATRKPKQLYQLPLLLLKRHSHPPKGYLSCIT